MSLSPISIARNNALIDSLFRGEDLTVALRETGLSPARALQVLRAQRSRAKLTALRRLKRIQKSILLQDSGPDAVSALLRQLHDSEHADRQLRSALALLNLTTPKPRRRAPIPYTPKPPRETKPRMSDAKFLALMGYGPRRKRKKTGQAKTVTSPAPPAPPFGPPPAPVMLPP